MRWSILLLVTLSFIILLSAYLLLNLNPNIVTFDFLFNEIQTSLGILLLSSFVFGSLVSLFLEVLYFSRKNKNK